MVVVEGEPSVDHPADNRSFSRHFESPDWLTGERIREQGKVLALQLTPAANITVGVPNEVDRAFPHVSPDKCLHGILHDVNFDQRARWNQVSHGLIFQAHDRIAIVSRI
jgi:hypothetical protein